MLFWGGHFSAGGHLETLAVRMWWRAWDSLELKGFEWMGVGDCAVWDAGTHYNLQVLELWPWPAFYLHTVFPSPVLKTPPQRLFYT